MLQVAVEQVLQAVVQAEGDEEAVKVEAEGVAVLRNRGRRSHHPPTLSQPPQQLLQVCQLLWDEQTSPGEKTQKQTQNVFSLQFVSSELVFSVSLGHI